jgi:Anti-sigma-K factor rskA
MSGVPARGRGHDHAAFDELAVGWALHALEPEDEAVFARHLPDCSRCAGTVAETTEVMAAMAADLPLAEPSAALRDRVREAVAGTEQVSRPAPPEDVGRPAAEDDVLRELFAPPEAAPPATAGLPLPAAPPAGPPAAARPTWRRVLPVGLAAAAVAAIVGLGIWNVFLVQSRDEAMATATERAAVVEQLLEPGSSVMARLTDDDGTAKATLVSRGEDMTVVVQDLPVNDAESETYVLWGVGDDGPVPLDTFDVERSAWDVQTVNSGPTTDGGFPSYAVSLEPGNEAPPEPSGVVASGKVTS